MEDCWATKGDGPPWWYVCSDCGNERGGWLDANSYSWACPQCGGHPVLLGPSEVVVLSVKDPIWRPF